MAEFSKESLRIWKKRYLSEGETPTDRMLACATALAEVEKLYGKKTKADIDKLCNQFFTEMDEHRFTLAGRSLTNLGSDNGVVANCIVLGLDDSMVSVGQTLNDAILLQQAGSGLGFDFTALRPANYSTSRSAGQASGPVSFLSVYDHTFATIKQQGRHGANMAMMDIRHPDILDFIHCKEEEGRIANFNITVKISDEFMETLRRDPIKEFECQWPVYGIGEVEVLSPRRIERDGTEIKSITKVTMTYGDMFDEICQAAWTNGEPGIAFIDTINTTNPLPGLGPLLASNPCGEQFLHPGDNCNLGHINLTKFKGKIGMRDGIDWDKLEETTRIATRMLDNVIDTFDFPVESVNKMARANRRVGLGTMGLADLLYKLRIAYDSKEGVVLAQKIHHFIREKSFDASLNLADEKGPFPNVEESIWASDQRQPRNAALTTIAPTGTVAMLFDVSSGCEPNFALLMSKFDKDQEVYHTLNPILKSYLLMLGSGDSNPNIPYDSLIKHEGFLKTGSIQDVSWISDAGKAVFKIATEIEPRWHIDMQGALQKEVDNSISKTINMPFEATIEEVRKVYSDAHILGCKSVTVYRSGSRELEVLKPGIVTVQNQPVKANGYAPVRKRPNVLNGSTEKVKTRYGTAYITKNVDGDGKPFELFATMGKPGTVMYADLSAISRLISMLLRVNADPAEIIKQLEDIESDTIWFEGSTIKSIPDAIAYAMDSWREEPKRGLLHVEGIVDTESDLIIQNEDTSSYIVIPCKECGGMMMMQENCPTCQNCGIQDCN